MAEMHRHSVQIEIWGGGMNMPRFLINLKNLEFNLSAKKVTVFR